MPPVVRNSAAADFQENSETRSCPAFHFRNRSSFYYFDFRILLFHERPIMRFFSSTGHNDSKIFWSADAYLQRPINACGGAASPAGFTGYTGEWLARDALRWRIYFRARRIWMRLGERPCARRMVRAQAVAHPVLACAQAPGAAFPVWMSKGKRL
ncbi:hypothetical protein ABC383_19900 [Noviherbaspirillum sp. 1P10PC]|uniref:hypothetical protein n=1 Tax=Noviherbaspirillum sp. 1P10PC TaxID=3132292 RepID=UPI00399F78D6